MRSSARVRAPSPSFDTWSFEGSSRSSMEKKQSDAGASAGAVWPDMAGGALILVVGCQASSTKCFAFPRWGPRTGGAVASAGVRLIYVIPAAATTPAYSLLASSVPSAIRHRTAHNMLCAGTPTARAHCFHSIVPRKSAQASGTVSDCAADCAACLEEEQVRRGRQQSGAG